MKQLFYSTLMLLSAFFAISATYASVIIQDEFNDNMLDPSWNITFQNVDSWTYSENGTELSVSDIDPTVIGSGGNGEWSRVILTQQFKTVSDFSLSSKFEWDSDNTIRAEQLVMLAVLDSSGNRIAYGGYNDPWLDDRGQKVAIIDSQFVGSGPSSLPFSGATVFEINRTNGMIDILWDSVSLFSFNDTTPVGGIELQFGFYSNTRTGGPAIFGSESVDYVRFQGTVVSAPSVLLLTAPFFLGIVATRGKIRNTRERL